MDTTLQDPLVGRELDGRYLVRSRIARGGMATVYLALDRRLDREVAIKVMHAHLADDEQFTARFIREARAAARLSHPNVVQVYDQGAEGDLLYLAMEHLRGRTLREVLAERRVLTAREALTVIEPLLDALSAAHRVGIVHRDVKPENVILTDDGRVKVADFGLARAATASTSTTGVLLGTIGYLAPELVVRGVADARSDVYAAGIMLFEMLTGRLPFSGGVPIQVAYQHVNDQVPAPSTLVPGLDPRLDELVLSATAREPDDRPADAGDFLARVRAVHAELPPAQLDVRPAPPAGSTGDSAGRPTEVFAPLPSRHETQALPELVAPSPVAVAENGSAPRPRGAAASARTGAASAATGAATAAAPRSPHLGPHQRPHRTSALDSGDHRSGGFGGFGGPAGQGQGQGQGQGRDDEDAALGALLRRRRVIGISALLTVLALALGLAGAAWYYAIGPGAYVATPTVGGLDLAAAREKLGQNGLRSTQTDVFDAAVAAGLVVSTRPDAGRPVRKDGSVELHVSRGPEFVVVPAVLGRSESDARSALETAHLTVAETVQKYSDETKGDVVGVDPKAGTQVRNGTEVTLTVSKGPEPVTVPDLVGRSRSQAESALRALRLGVVYGPEQFSDTVPEGSVISQTPNEGTLLPRQKVTLVLSKGPERVAVPNVVGKQFGEARSILRAAGFDVRRADVLGGFFGTVRAQLPGPGAMAPKGSTILLTVV